MFLEHCNLLRGKLIIFGDFNIHFDCPSNSITSKTRENLSTFNVVRAVKESTHKREHILDWVLYREDERLLRSCTVGHNVPAPGVEGWLLVGALGSAPEDPDLSACLADLSEHCV